MASSFNGAATVVDWSSSASSSLSPDQLGGSSPSSQAAHTPTSSNTVSSSRSPNDAGPSRKVSTAPGQPRRRIRPKIALDPSQPLTAQGKPRARVYVACNQCRTRKTRCDGAKPVCFHCRKRPPENGEQCSYEPQPKRRGQDKAPGARAQKVSKRRRTSGDEYCQTGSDSGSSSGSARGERSASPQQYDPGDDLAEFMSDDSVSEYDPFASVDINAVLKLPDTSPEAEDNPQAGDAESIPARPSLQFTRETWWDALLTFYASDGATPAEAITLTPEQRSTAMRGIVGDLRVLFYASIYWTSFIHLPRFFDSVLHPARRATMQPALLLGALAAGILAQSSEAERGAAGRARAVKLLDLADGAIQASLASGWVDIGLIQAAWFLAYFEMQSHPLHSLARGRSSLLLLDSLLRLFSLTKLDADIVPAHPPRRIPGMFGHTTTPAASAAPLNGTFADTGIPFSTHFGLGTPSFAPPTPAHALTDPIVPDHATLGPSTTPPTGSCNCAELTISHHWPSVRGFAPSWSGTLMWPNGLSEGEFRKEEGRRLVWSTVMMTASLNSYSSVTDEFERTELCVKDPRNFALLYPGESLSRTGAPVPANNVWTLYLRAMLLLHACVAARADATMCEADRAQFAMRAWLEVDTLESALDQHTCGLERTFGFQAREILFGARMCVSHEFQRYIPQVTTTGAKLFYRDKAESWLRGRMEAADRVWDNLMQGLPSPAMDYRKPLLIYWFMSHIIKALVLWRADPTLIVALEASKSYVRRGEYLMMYWPNSEQRREWQKLRYKLVEACLQAGIPPPTVSVPAPFPRKKSADPIGAGSTGFSLPTTSQHFPPL